MVIFGFNSNLTYVYTAVNKTSPNTTVPTRIAFAAVYISTARRRLLSRPVWPMIGFCHVHMLGCKHTSMHGQTCLSISWERRQRAFNESPVSSATMWLEFGDFSFRKIISLFFKW